MIKKLTFLITDFFHRPLRVLWFCGGFVFILLVVEGSLLRLWGLHRHHYRLEKNVENLKTEAEVLRGKLKIANQPEFLEKQARDQLEMVNKGELVFVFSEE